jgi:hypothetical protein
LRHWRRSGVNQRTPSPAADQIVLDSLGKLAAHGHGVGGYCRACRRLFWVSCSADRVLVPDRDPL